MKSTLHEHEILEDLYHTCRAKFGFDLIHAEPIRRGWLNLKWRIQTNNGTYLLKQYNKDRLKKYSIHDLKNVFWQQNRLHAQDFPCPRILTHKDEVFFQSERGERFVLMEYCTGNTLKPGILTNDQQYTLGLYTGKLHLFLNDGSMPPKSKAYFNPPGIKARSNYWGNVLDKVHTSDKQHLIPIIEKQRILTKTFNIDGLMEQRTGWAHRDLWVDNILFTNNQLTAILDFDRMNYDYLSLDIARAVISGALNSGKLNTQGAFAFLEGYRSIHPIESGFLSNALKLLWYMESEWWLDLRMDERKGPPKRFVQEMIWLSDHLLELDSMLENN